MASWMIHLRVAQRLYQQLHIEPADTFVLGNIAPDSGVPTADKTGFIPDAAVSHFRSLDENGMKAIHEDLFIARYFTPRHCSLYTSEQYAFFLGYLTHLLTDQLWERDIAYPAKEKQSSLFQTNRELFWQTVKKDWYDLDFMYLKANPTFEAFRLYRENTNIQNTYVDFFSANAFEERRRFILDFYADGAANIVEHDTSLSKKELDDFVRSAAEEIMDFLNRIF